MRAFLLYISSYTLFTVKFNTRVPVIYLQLLMDLDVMHTYASGATALAYMYRQLGFTTRVGVEQIIGYLTLMEAWIFEHFSHCRPTPGCSYEPAQPRMHRWIPQRESGVDMSLLHIRREALDRLRAHEVI